MAAWHVGRIVALLFVMACALGCEQTLTLELTHPEVVVSTDAIAVEGRVSGGDASRVEVRYTVTLRDTPHAVSAQGMLPVDDTGRFVGRFTLDEPLLYSITVRATAPGCTPAEITSDFRYSLPPIPPPRLIEPETGTTLYTPSVPLRRALRIGTRSGLRIDVLRDGTLVARALADEDELSVEVDLYEGANALEVHALDDRSSSRAAVDLTVVVGPAPLDEPAVQEQAPGIPPRGDATVLRPDPPGATSNVADPARPEEEEIDHMAVPQVDAGVEVIAPDVDAEVDAFVPDMDVEPDAARPSPADKLDRACATGALPAVVEIYQEAAGIALTGERAWCIARALGQAGRCADASRMARSIAARGPHRAHATLLMLRCAEAGSSAAAEHARSLVELRLAGALGISPADMAAELGRAGLSDAQRARVVEPCRSKATDPVCIELMPADVSALCTAGRAREASEAHARGATVPDAQRHCVATGHAEAGRRDAAIALLEALMNGDAAGQTTGEAGRLLASLSSGGKAASALRQVVSVVAQATYRPDDMPALAAEISAAAAGDARRRALIAEPCTDVSERAQCRRLLDALGLRAVAEPGRLTVSFSQDGCRAEVTGREAHVTGAKGDTGQLDLPPGRYDVRFTCPGGDAPAVHSVEITEGATTTLQQPEPTKRGRAPAPAVRHQLELEPANTRFFLEIDGTYTAVETRAGRVSLDESQMGIGALNCRVVRDGRTDALMIDIEYLVRKKRGPLAIHVPNSGARHALSSGLAALTRGEWSAAVRHFSDARTADSRYCLAYAYLGYAQAMTDKSALASGSYRQCISSLKNDAEGVTTAQVLQAVTRLRAQVDEAPAKTLKPLVDRLQTATGRIATMYRALPDTKERPIRLRALSRYWLAVGRAALFEKLKSEGAKAAAVESARTAALQAWQELPATRSAIGVGSIRQTKTSYADERTRALRALTAGAAQ